MNNEIRIPVHAELILNLDLGGQTLSLVEKAVTFPKQEPKPVTPSGAREQQIETIKKMRAQGKTKKEIAEVLGTNPFRIGYLVNKYILK